MTYLGYLYPSPGIYITFCSYSPWLFSPFFFSSHFPLPAAPATIPDCFLPYFLFSFLSFHLPTSSIFFLYTSLFSFFPPSSSPSLFSPPSPFPISFLFHQLFCKHTFHLTLRQNHFVRCIIFEIVQIYKLYIFI